MRITIFKGFPRVREIQAERRYYITRQMVFNRTRAERGFAEVCVCEDGKNGLQRDLIIGIKAQTDEPLLASPKVIQASPISGTPNHISPGAVAGTKNVTWEVAGDQVGEVLLFVNGGDKTLFFRLPQRSSEASRINAGGQCRFKLYRGVESARNCSASCM